MTAQDEQWKAGHCALCERPLTHQDALISGGGIQVLALGVRCHRKCYQERYQERVWQPPAEEQAVMQLEEAA